MNVILRVLNDFEAKIFSSWKRQCKSFGTFIQESEVAFPEVKR